MTQERLERIQLLSRRFHELQGLRVAITGAVLATVMAAYVIVTPSPTNDGAMLALGIAILPIFVGVMSLNRYYATTFGRQVRRPLKNSRSVVIFVCSYMAVAWTLNTMIPAIPSGAPTVAIVAVGSVLVALRDWPWRAYYLGAPVAVGATFAATASGFGLLPPGVTLASLFIAVGASMVAIGLLDHRLLMKLMQETRELETAR
jgi:hypothetical protein